MAGPCLWDGMLCYCTERLFTRGGRIGNESVLASSKEGIDYERYGGVSGEHSGIIVDTGCCVSLMGTWSPDAGSSV